MFSIPMLRTDSAGRTHWTTWDHDLGPRGGMMLSEQIGAQNFRLRTSAAGYASDWHTAGDPTLLVVLSGALEIETASGEARLFQAGDAFVAADDPPAGVDAKPALTGHCARVVGDQQVRVLHLKLGPDALAG